MKIRLLIPILAGLLTAGNQLNGAMQSQYTIKNNSNDPNPKYVRYCFFDENNDWICTKETKLANQGTLNFSLSKDQILHSIDVYTPLKYGGFTTERLQVSNHPTWHTFTINQNGKITPQ